MTNKKITKIEDLGHCDACREGDDNARTDAIKHIASLVGNSEVSSFTLGRCLESCRKCYESNLDTGITNYDHATMANKYII